MYRTLVPNFNQNVESTDRIILRPLVIYGFSCIDFSRISQSRNKFVCACVRGLIFKKNRKCRALFCSCNCYMIQPTQFVELNYHIAWQVGYKHTFLSKFCVQKKKSFSLHFRKNITRLIVGLWMLCQVFFLSSVKQLISWLWEIAVSWTIVFVHSINPLALELDFYSLAHHLCKMWIFYEPRRVIFFHCSFFIVIPCNRPGYIDY